ncbi:hypothetical protein AF335_07255 [Streptomyces eurocidicus]|uniref:DUF2797 domain-containing protein n=1 Tax=Streptomyces eurocidicus TaxID=66423 RepID=A0A2N8P046_STREU|nr:DUF2797 domain-containing protein [Streptomyces eurocidicus]MBB5118933.1 hypothetical protein [Streptomyces eurocidicus]MBF6051261.1 DUF2797 domain-containing protein [Streptomyces eurocidicus]PNE34396.1 hypothetical protein AF335_07255 [Streptomyces eurocidicus]
MRAGGDDWRCAGVRWRPTGPELAWLHPVHGGRASALPAGRPLAFASGDARRCLGVRRGGRHTPCPVGAALTATAVSSQCAECARLDRAHSVAADTIADDPRPYDVYLAWFAPGLIKVGITAAEREGARLREQAALSYALLGRGPLMAARRAEAVLGAALAVPDRFPYAAKRAARHPLPTRELRTAELAELHGRALGLAGLPESPAVRAFAPVHHDEEFHLDRLRPGHGLVELSPGCAISGRVAAVAGPDLYLDAADGRLLLVDTRQLAGWALRASDPGAAVTATVRPPEPAGPEALF